MPLLTIPEHTTTALKAIIAILSHVQGLSAAALRTIIANVINDDLNPEDLLNPTPALAKQSLTGYTRAQKASEAWLTGIAYLNPKRCWATLQHLDADVIIWGSPQYPSLLNQIHNPPACLFTRGNQQLLASKTLAMVGTRKITSYGHEVITHLVEGLSTQTPGKVTIVSGLAAGVDGAAHRAAIDNDCPTIAVFGCGIDTIYPNRHKVLADDILNNNGLLISEYPPGYPGSKYTYPQRNRIIAGLSYGTVIIEGELKSGSLITARLALEENRSVFASPGNLFNPMMAGPHQLLKDGAVLVTSAEDIVEELGWVSAVLKTDRQPTLFESASQPQPDKADLIDDDQQLLQHIGYDPTAIELIATRSGLAMTDLQPRLLMLELSGQLKTYPGACVAKV
jgi:DNA processing protein